MSQIIEDLVEKIAREKILREEEKLIRNLMETMEWSAEQAMSAMKISEMDKVILLPRLTVVEDSFYAECNIEYLKKVVDDIESGKANLSEHQLIED